MPVGQLQADPEALVDDAHLGEKNFPVIGMGTQELSDQGVHRLVQGRDRLAPNPLEDDGALDQLAREQRREDRVPAPAGNASNQRADAAGQPLLRRRLGRHASIAGIRPALLLERASPHLGVERRLGSEVVVDRRDVGAGLVTDLRHGRPSVAAFTEHPTGGGQQIIVSTYSISSYSHRGDLRHGLTPQF